ALLEARAQGAVARQLRPRIEQMPATRLVPFSYYVAGPNGGYVLQQGVHTETNHERQAMLSSVDRAIANEQRANSELAVWDARPLLSEADLRADLLRALVRSD